MRGAATHHFRAQRTGEEPPTTHASRYPLGSERGMILTRCISLEAYQLEFL